MALSVESWWQDGCLAVSAAIYCSEKHQDTLYHTADELFDAVNDFLDTHKSGIIINRDALARALWSLPALPWLEAKQYMIGDPITSQKKATRVMADMERGRMWRILKDREFSYGKWGAHYKTKVLQMSELLFQQCQMHVVNSNKKNDDISTPNQGATNLKRAVVSEEIRGRKMADEEDMFGGLEVKSGGSGVASASDEPEASISSFSFLSPGGVGGSSEAKQEDGEEVVSSGFGFLSRSEPEPEAPHEEVEAEAEGASTSSFSFLSSPPPVNQHIDGNSEMPQQQQQQQQEEAMLGSILASPHESIKLAKAASASLCAALADQKQSKGSSSAHLLLFAARNLA